MPKNDFNHIQTIEVAEQIKLLDELNAHLAASYTETIIKFLQINRHKLIPIVNSMGNPVAIQMWKLIARSSSSKLKEAYIALFYNIKLLEQLEKNIKQSLALSYCLRLRIDTLKKKRDILTDKDIADIRKTISLSNSTANNPDRNHFENTKLPNMVSVKPTNQRLKQQDKIYTPSNIVGNLITHSITNTIEKKLSQALESGDALYFHELLISSEASLLKLVNDRNSINFLLCALDLPSIRELYLSLINNIGLLQQTLTMKLSREARELTRNRLDKLQFHDHSNDLNNNNNSITNQAMTNEQPTLTANSSQKRKVDRVYPPNQPQLLFSISNFLNLIEKNKTARTTKETSATTPTTPTTTSTQHQIANENALPEQNISTDILIPDDQAETSLTDQEIEKFFELYSEENSIEDTSSIKMLGPTRG